MWRLVLGEEGWRPVRGHPIASCVSRSGLADVLFMPGQYTIARARVDVPWLGKSPGIEVASCAYGRVAAVEAF